MEKKIQLPNGRKCDLILTLEDLRWNKDDFIFKENPAEKVLFSVEYFRNGYFFNVLADKEMRLGYRFAPAGESDVFRKGRDVPWDSVLEGFRTWLASIEDDLRSGDLWDELRESLSTNAASFVEDGEINGRFNEDEIAALTGKIDELAAALDGLIQDSEGRHRKIISELDYLKKAATRLGRKDWMNVAFGTLCGRVAGMVHPEHLTLVQETFTQIARNVHHLLNP